MEERALKAARLLLDIWGKEDGGQNSQVGIWTLEQIDYYC